MKELMWWGYLHYDGVIILKRWFGDVKDYTTDIKDNDFVLRVVKPFPAKSYEQALEHLVNALDGRSK
jgi:hypothetical protein